MAVGALTFYTIVPAQFYSKVCAPECVSQPLHTPEKAKSCLRTMLLQSHHNQIRRAKGPPPLSLSEPFYEALSSAEEEVKIEIKISPKSENRVCAGKEDIRIKDKNQRQFN